MTQVLTGETCLSVLMPAARTLRVGLLGLGRVGQAVAALAARPDVAERLLEVGVRLDVAGAVVRDARRPRQADEVPLFDHPDTLVPAGCDAVVEVLGGVEPARTWVAAALRAGTPVVTANKSLMAACGPDLVEIARRHGTPLAWDAAVVAGVPFLGALARRPLFRSARRFTGIVNGTSHFVLSAMAEGASLPDAVRHARARGYAEADPSADLSGRDAAEKLTVLLHLAGCRDVRPADLPTQSLDAVESRDLAGARAVGGVIKPVACASCDAADPGAWIGPGFVVVDHRLAALSGVDNGLTVTGAGGDEVTFVGPGAGPDVTAATILDDLVEVVGTGRPPAACPPRHGLSRAAFRTPGRQEWFLRVSGRGTPEPGDLARLLALADVPAMRVAELDGAVYLRTVRAAWDAIAGVERGCRSAGLATVVLPVVR